MSIEKLAIDDYDIVIDKELQSVSDFLAANNYSNAVILVDSLTHKLCLPVLHEKCPTTREYKIIEVPNGEEFKHLDSCQIIWRRMLEYALDRSSLVINLGGGVIGDMGGFAASCYKRGIDFINIPTTILSQVDASIGGKLGVDFEHGKNLIGLFKNPKMVVVSELFYNTLSDQQIKNGFAEVYKHALVYNAEEWSKLKVLKSLDLDVIGPFVHRSLAIKRAIVLEDPFEKHLRKVLNFGHTVGHAIEAWSLDQSEDPLLHGEAIAIGMICETYLSHKKSGLSKETMAEICQFFYDQYRSYSWQEKDESTIFNYMKLDKKNQGNRIMSVLLKDIGVPEIDVELSQAEVVESLQFYQNTAWQD